MGRLQPQWKNEPTFTNLNMDYQDASASRDKQIAKILEYRENMEGGKAFPQSVRNKGKSTVRPLVIRKQAEWTYPMLEEPFLSTNDLFNIQPRSGNDEEASHLNTILINWIMNTKLDKSQFVSQFVRVLYDEGTVIVKDGWNTEFETVMVDKEVPIYASPEESLQILQNAVVTGQMSEETAQAMIETGEPVTIGTRIEKVEKRQIVENMATIEVVDSTTITVDPTCDGQISKAKFIIHEYDTDIAELTMQKYEKIQNEDGTYSEFGVYHDIDKIAIDGGGPSEVESYEVNADDKQAFEFSDKARKKLRAYEYWGYWDIDGTDELVPIVATWVNDVLIRLEKSPYAHNELPFSVARYMPRQKEFWGEPDGALLKENQETIGTYTRAMHNQTITNALGQRLVEETLFSSPSQWQSFLKGNDARYRPGADPDKMIWKQKVEPIDSSIMDMINYQRNDAESMSGVTPFNGGITGDALGKSATGVRAAMDATTRRKLSVLRRVSDELLINLARHILINAHSFLEDEIIIRLTDGQYQKLSKEELQMEFDLKVEINTPEKDQDISDKIAFMLQTTMQTMPFDLTKTLLAKWARTNKLEDVAAEILAVEAPGPSQAQQELEQIQLQNAKLENERLTAEIHKLYAERDKLDANTSESINRMSDDGIKVEKARADAMYREAQARKLNSETDKIDKDFLDDVDGVKRQQQVEDQQFQADVAMYHTDVKAKIEELRAQQKQSGENK